MSARRVFWIEAYALLAGQVLDAARVRGVARVGEVEADRVADAGGESALQDEEAAVGHRGDLGDAQAGVGAIGVLGAQREVAAPALPGLPADDARGVAGDRVLHGREEPAAAGEESEPLEGLVGGGAAGRGDAERVRHRQTVEDAAVAEVAAYGGFRLGGDEPGAVLLDGQALGVEGGARLVGEGDDARRGQGPPVEGEEGGAVGEGGEVAVPVDRERGEVADERAVVRRLVEGVGEAVEGDGGRTGVACRALAFTGPAAVRQVAAARVAVTVASRVRGDRGLRGLRELRCFAGFAGFAGAWPSP